MPLGAFKAALMGTAGVSTGDVVLLHDTDYSNAASASITSGITSTYGEYIFKFYNINPATDGQKFMFQVNASGESGYNETTTSTVFQSYHLEDDSAAALEYKTSHDQAQGTAYQKITAGTGNGADESCVGELHLFNPSSTTYVTHFMAKSNSYDGGAGSNNWFVAGYFNITDAITGVDFKMESGNFDGTIKMWGVK
jgi:hypothetical protein